MKYYIVVNEWKYPTETGREIVGDFDTPEDALYACRTAFSNEYSNFVKVNDGQVYHEASDLVVDDELQPLGYYLCSSPHEEENMFFRSMIITREI